AVQGGGLPSGLKVTPAGSDNSILQFSGSTDFVGDQTFEIWSVNSYDPNIIVKRSFTVKFTAAPPPDGPASIETEEAR
ncbi:MAG TPA: hypothetical protein VIJ54_12640, partial [Actinomycetes bacterium]